MSARRKPTTPLLHSSLLAAAMVLGAAMLGGGCTCAADNDGYVAPQSDQDPGGTPDGIVLSKLQNMVLFRGSQESQNLKPMMEYGIQSPLLVRTATNHSDLGHGMVPTYGRVLIYPEGGMAREYGLSQKVLGPSPLDPTPNAPLGIRGMFGYRSRDGLRADPHVIPQTIDMAEAVYPDGSKCLLFAVGSNIIDGDLMTGFAHNHILPYRFVTLSAVALYRMPKPAPGQSPEIKHVLTYIHPGMVHDVDIEQWQDANGKNHIICLCAGNDDYTGRNAHDEYMAANGMGAPPFSENSPSIFYLSFYPKGPAMFADEVLSRLDDMPGGISAVPDRGPVAVRFPREDAEFGYREEGVFHPFPSVDLTKWQGDMDYGFRRAPVFAEMPQRDNDQLAVHQIMSVELSPDGRIGVEGCVMYLTSPIHWVPDAPGSLPLSYQLTREGIIE